MTAAPQCFRSFGEQTIHYFDRPHTGLPVDPVGGPAGMDRWRVDRGGRTQRRREHSPIFGSRSGPTRSDPRLADCTKTAPDVFHRLRALLSPSEMAQDGDRARETGNESPLTASSRTRLP